METACELMNCKVLAKKVTYICFTRTAVLMLDNSVVDLDAIEALYENVSAHSTLFLKFFFISKEK